jgi:hypothetical protein
MLLYKMVKIINVIDSPRKTKKYRAIFNDDTYIDFGLRGSSTYLDHKDKKKRENYWKRHVGSENERELLHWVIPSPATLSALLLWNKETLGDSIKDLNHIWATHTIDYT